MPRLYCHQHGQEHEAATKARQEFYRQEGETVVIIKGRLIDGPFLCDRCNAELKEGDPACLASAFPRWITESTHDYKFTYEFRYFALEDDAITVYGAPWPCMDDLQEA
jgi:hypothetical protein